MNSEWPPWILAGEKGSPSCTCNVHTLGSDHPSFQSQTWGLISPIGEGGSVPSKGKWRLREMNTKAPLSTPVQCVKLNCCVGWWGGGLNFKLQLLYFLCSEWSTQNSPFWRRFNMLRFFSMPHLFVIDINYVVGWKRLKCSTLMNFANWDQWLCCDP